jgi:hypothetical protein
MAAGPYRQPRDPGDPCRQNHQFSLSPDIENIAIITMLKYFIDTNQYIVYDLSKLQKKALT